MSCEHSVNAGQAGTYGFAERTVVRMGFGAMQLARCVDSPEQAFSVLENAIELGVNHIDTAQFYGNGFVNNIVAQALRLEPELVVATKVGADANPGGEIPIKPAQRPEQLRRSVEDNLRSLGSERLAIVNLRRLDVGPGLSAQGDQIVDLDDQLAELIAMRDEGKIGAIGLSGVDLNRLVRALPANIVCVQNAYSLVSRQYEDMLDLCATHGIPWVPFFPLGGAHFPKWPKVTDHPLVIDIAKNMRISESQVGLAWLLAHKPNILLIPGTADLTHLKENIGATAVRFSSEVLSALDGLASGFDKLEQEPFRG